MQVRKFKKVAALGLAVSMILGMLTISASAAETGSYSDVSEKDWFTDAVEYVTAKGYMNGIETELFAPLMDTNRAMVVTVLYRMETEIEEVEAAAFTDLDSKAGAWYMDAVAWAAANDIARGYPDGTFRPMTPVSREELVTFFYRWAQYKGYRTSLEADLSTYADAEKVQAYAKDAMAWAVAAGLIEGIAPDTLSPLATANRAQIAMMLYRLADGGKVLAAITIDEDLGDNDTPLAETPDLPTPPAPHVHSYTWVVTSQPTCTEAGVETGTCAADGATQTREIAALGHDVVNHEAKAATCTEIGWNAYETCSRCDYTTYEEIAALGHEMQEVEGSAQAATCAAEGKEADKKCSRCDYTEAGATIAATGHHYVEGVCECGDLNAEGVTKAAAVALNGKLAEITGNSDKQIVSVTIENDVMSALLDVDAIQANDAVNIELDGLMTKISNALKETFGGYALSVAGYEVYDANGNFQNTNLKNALYEAAKGGFVKLSKMEADNNGIYTFGEPLSAKVAGETEYEFDLAIQLKGEDVGKVKSLATKLADYFTMEKLDADTVAERYNYTGGESEYIVVGVKMPGTLMNTAEIMAQGHGDSIQAAFDSLTVEQAVNMLAKLSLGDIITTEMGDVTSVINTVNSNEALINKVLSKLTVSVNGDQLIMEEFEPDADEDKDAWQNFMTGVKDMVYGSAVLNTTVGSYRTTGTTYYVVPVTVAIDLESSLDFTATETVLVVMNINFGGETEPEQPEEPTETAETVTTAAVAALNGKLAEITGNGGAQIVSVELDGQTMIATLNVDAIQANNAVNIELDGLMTKIGDALEATFGNYTLSVADYDVYVNGAFQNTNLKNALYEAAKGGFEALKSMNEVKAGVYEYKSLKAQVKGEGDDTFLQTLSIRLSGGDAGKVKSLATKLADYFTMEKLDADTVAERYNYTGSENEYIVVGVKMPATLMDTAEIMAQGHGDSIQAAFDSLTVEQAVNMLARLSLGDIITTEMGDVTSVINTVNSNEALINKVLSKLTVSVNGDQLIMEEFEPDADEDKDAWQNFMTGVKDMVYGSAVLNTTVGSYRTTGTTYYVVPVTVAIDLESSLDFTATETVLVVMNINFGE